MVRRSSTPPIIRRACEALAKSGVCRIVRSVESIDDLFSQLTLAFDVPQPNPEGLPTTVVLDCCIRHPYPFGEIEMIPKGSEVSGFAHQAVDGGKLCLPSAQDAPWNEYRLLHYAEWTKEWIVDAAHGRLLKVGDPYELPDFRQNEIHDPAFAQVSPILLDDSPATLASWDGRVGQAGTVSLSSCKAANAIAATDWFASDKNAIRRAPFSPAFLRGAHRFTGQWILLPRITSVRVRPPRTYEELAKLCRVSNVDLESVLRRAWLHGHSGLRIAVVLLGCPIPATVGGPTSEIHWQPLLLLNRDGTKHQYKGRGKRDDGLLWRIAQETVFAPSRRLTYGQASNVAPQRQYARGAAPAAFATQSVAIIGVGAIGSLLAETFARAGVSPLSLFDDDHLDFGNLCRHTLDGSDVGKYKASALAARLSSANPLSVIEAFAVDVPFQCSASEPHSVALANATVLVDCSTDQGAFLWLSRFARQNRKRLASLFINRNATLLTLILSGRNTTAEKVFERLNATIEAGSTLVDAREYLGTGDTARPLLPGAGCWHPTFPGRNNHIAMLVAAAVDHIYAWLRSPSPCDGRAVVLRRRDSSPMIDVGFEENYR